MNRLLHRRTAHLVCALLLIGGGRVAAQTQTPGQVTKFDPSLSVVDSVITEDPSGNIGIGTTTPAAALDVASGDLNVAGNLLKGGILFLHDSGGVGNTFLGQQAGHSSTTGGYNTASGFQSFFSNTSGSDNTASGVFALFSNTDGVANTAIGSAALYFNSSGSYNTAIGVDALHSNTTFGGNTATGVTALYSNTTGVVNTASGVDALFSNTTGGQNTAMGAGALGNNTSGQFNTAIGYGADVIIGNLSNATAIGADARVDSSNKIRLGNPFVTVIEGQVPYTFTSDRHQKENFHAVDREAVLTKVSGLNVSSWNYIGHNPQQFRHYGPVAQEFFAAFGRDEVGTIGTPTTINSGDLEGILMIAVQALEKRTAENADLRTRIDRLEKLVNTMAATKR